MSVFDVPLWLVYWLGLFLAVALLCSGGATLVVAARDQRRHDREEAVRPGVRGQLVERLFSPDPSWRSWVDGLSTTERRVAREEVDAAVRNLRGDDRRGVQDAGEALGLVEEARATVQRGPSSSPVELFRVSHFRLLEALSWLVLLERPVDDALLERAAGESPDHRAAAARVLHATDHPEAAALGTRILLGDGDESLTTFGLDTLYRLNRADPTPLLTYGARAHDDWRASLTIQVLRVVGKAMPSAGDAPLGWVFDAADHEAPEVRAAVPVALADHGWHPTVREAFPVDDLATDPDPTVRRSTGEMLAAWGDETAVSRLEAMTRTEPDGRTRLALADLLADHRGPEWDAPASVDDVWRWVWADRRLLAREADAERSGVGP